MKVIVSVLSFVIVGTYSAMVFESCCNKKAVPMATTVNYAPGIVNQVIKHDTVFVGGKEDPQMYQIMYGYLRDSMQHNYDSVTAANERLARKLLLAQFKLKEIEKYNNITIANKSQLKYLNGWIKRALK